MCAIFLSHFVFAVFWRTLVAFGFVFHHDWFCRLYTFIEINADRNAVYVGNMQYQNDLRHFDTRSYLFPITKSVINANSAISDSDQNPGWE